jgi:N-hydroxyarylamine O-acetyltransferase
MNPVLDLDAYFRRIGYAGSRTPALDTLRAIHGLHPQAIAFENLDPLLRQPVRLDVASLENKLVRGGRGGYCFEQNLLLYHALKALGFAVRGLGARVIWGAPEGAVTARVHMLLRVDVGGTPYIADVGFGGLTLTGPLRLAADGEQATPHEPFRLTKSGDDFVLQARIQNAWVPLYRFDLQEQFQSDYDVANWYHSTHPNAYFTTNLVAGRPAPGLRYALHNNELAVHHLDGSTERRVLRTDAELRGTLTGTFGLTLPDARELDALLARVTVQAA